VNICISHANDQPVWQFVILTWYAKWAENWKTSLSASDHPLGFTCSTLSMKDCCKANMGRCSIHCRVLSWVNIHRPLSDFHPTPSWSRFLPNNHPDQATPPWTLTFLQGCGHFNISRVSTTYFHNILWTSQPANLPQYLPLAYIFPLQTSISETVHKNKLHSVSYSGSDLSPSCPEGRRC